MSRARAAGSIAAAAFADVKRGLRAPRLAAADADAEGRRLTFDLWTREDSLQRIREFLEKTIGKK